jgi:hypothetical protein
MKSSQHYFPFGKNGKSLDNEFGIAGSEFSFVSIAANSIANQINLILL